MVALNKEKTMKIVTKIEGTYTDNFVPSALSIAEYKSFCKYQAEKYLKETGVESFTDLDKKSQDIYFEKNRDHAVSFKYFATAKQISKYVSQLKRDMKDNGFHKLEICYSAMTECSNDNEDGSVSDSTFISGASVSFKFTWKQFKQWAKDADAYEQAKVEYGHVNKVARHSIRVHAAHGAIWIWVQ